MTLIENPLNSSPLTFPVIECFHVVGFAISVGTIALVDFRLLGICMRTESPKQLLKETRPLTLVGLVLMLFSGLCLFVSDPDMYYLNPAFLLKMVLFGFGVLSNYTLHQRVVVRSASTRDGKLVGLLSLIIWTGVVFCGIFIAFL